MSGRNPKDFDIRIYLYVDHHKNRRKPKLMVPLWDFDSSTPSVLIAVYYHSNRPNEKEPFCEYEGWSECWIALD